MNQLKKIKISILIDIGIEVGLVTLKLSTLNQNSLIA